jgi:hypothetical protein
MLAVACGSRVFPGADGAMLARVTLDKEIASAQPMIMKDFFMAKTFCTYAIKILREEKILRDHETERRLQRYPRGWCARWGQRGGRLARARWDGHAGTADVLQAACAGVLARLLIR